jgi:predicted deacylase
MIPVIETIELLKLASGDVLGIQVYKFIGEQKGKKAYLQSNLHGSEIVGNAVIHSLIDYLLAQEASQLRGEIWLVPACNPLGMNQRNHFFSTGRFNSYDGKDWNRIFWDYEKECQDLDALARSTLTLDREGIREKYLEKQKEAFQRQLETLQKPRSVRSSDQYRYHLQSLCLDANYVIDIHSSSNQGIDYLYCFHGREASADYFLLECGILMTEYDGDAFDEAFMKPWLALEKQFAKLGRDIQFEVEAWTLELGAGMQMNPDSVEKGIRGIKNYLAAKGILALNNPTLGSLVASPTKLVKRDQIQQYYAPTGGMIQGRLPLKNSVKAGDRLYQILSFNKIGELPSLIDVYSETDGFIFDVSTNYSVNQGEYVLAIMNAEC